MKRVRMYCDGACKGNGQTSNFGGWAVYLLMLTLDGRYCQFDGRKVIRTLTGSVANTTNNRMELQAVIAGLQALNQPCQVEIVVDSKYVHEGITKYYETWVANGWRTSTKKPVKNQDLWMLLASSMKGHVITWNWTKGHAEDAGHNHVDVLASNAAEQLKYAATPFVS